MAGKVIRKLAQAAKTHEMHSRPIHVPLPVGILYDPMDPPRAQKAASAEDFCPQEFILEFQDASLASWKSPDWTAWRTIVA